MSEIKWQGTWRWRESDWKFKLSNVSQTENAEHAMQQTLIYNIQTVPCVAGLQANKTADTHTALGLVWNFVVITADLHAPLQSPLLPCPLSDLWTVTHLPTLSWFLWVRVSELLCAGHTQYPKANTVKHSEHLIATNKAQPPAATDSERSVSDDCRFYTHIMLALKDLIDSTGHQN